MKHVGLYSRVRGRLLGLLGRRLGQREEGVALLAVVVMVAVIAATTAEFSYSSRVDYVAAVNARDDLRAHYLARSGLALSRLLLRVQQKLIDPQIRSWKLGMDLQVSDYAPYIIQAFNKADDAEGLGMMLGVSGPIKGIGVDVGTFDLEMTSLDGRINVNCAGGANAGAPNVTRIAASLSAMMLSERYNPLFERADKDGQYNDRLTVLRAIIDWADQDTQMYGSSAPEDNRYNSGKDPYETKNHYYDTMDELRLVRGVDEEFMQAFGKYLTVYGRCKLNVSLADVPTIMALIMQYAATPSDPGLQVRNLALLAHYVKQIGELAGGFKTVTDFMKAAENPMAQLGQAASLDSLLGQGQTDTQQKTNLPPVQGVKVTAKIGEAITGSYVRRIWRVVGKAKVGLVQKKIITIWDQSAMSMHARNAGMGAGAYLYWREE
ncbi:MAG: hypothetical protein CSA65_07570 [Proteobacteria bacterium]|nr:MAG: hypothetical protein CSB49_01585 [Pseudomonadota bacterium]PIE17751.1 MAG: hypothetical protein CSA65_07570 [Pseudomonadota bacterium]